MPQYNCNLCNFTTKIKTHYNTHLNCKKHIKNKENKEGKQEKSYISDQKVTNLRPFYKNLVTKKRPFSDQLVTILSENSDSEKFICQYCEKTYKNKTHLYRHMRNSCKIKDNQEKNKEVEELKLIIKEQNEKNEKEKDKLYNYIDKLIDKTGDTNINIDKQLNNQIILNSFGFEDISHISDECKMKMLSLPYGMVQKMIERVHFNNSKPENRNIYLTNKRDSMIKVFSRKKWKYQDRIYVVEELIKNNYNRLDEYYEEYGKSKLNDVHKKRYKLFQSKFDNQDCELMTRLKKEAEMILLSDNLKN